MKTSIQTTQKRQRKGFTLVELLVVIAIIASLAGLSYGPIMKHLETSDRTTAVSNCKNIYSAMLGYMSANESTFPDDIDLPAAGNNSHEYFQLLFDGGHISDEKYFYHKQGARMGLADDAAIPNNDDALSADENVWGYVRGLRPSDGGSPFIFDSSADGAVFLTNTWKGKAIILRVDGGAQAYNIDLGTDGLDTTDETQTGQVFIKEGTADVDIMTTVTAGGTVMTPGT